MKIRTQSYLLIAGILGVPALLVIVQFIYLYGERYQEETFMYEDIIGMTDDGPADADEGGTQGPPPDFNGRKGLSRFIYRISKFGDIAVFGKDFTVIHSTIPQFSAGEVSSLEAIILMLNHNDGRHSYLFESPQDIENTGYVLIRRNTTLLRRPFGNLLYPVLTIQGLLLFLTIFSISMSLVITRSITKSVMVLEDATRRIAAGELDLTVDVKGSNEITSLTNSLNKMRDALKEEERRRYRFIMGVTHDLRTPLALIKAYTEAIEDGITEDPLTGAGATEIIGAKVDQLEGIIDDLIEFVRMDTGEWRSQLKNTNLSAFLRSSSRTFTMDAELLRHEFTFFSTLPEDIMVPMDERLVLRALENIINNAIRHSPEGSLICLNATIAGNALRLAVSDNGPGINPADLPHIFEMFYRGSSSRREQGMGLGLAVAKWVADCHGWAISASSAKGQGSCFTITIPMPNKA
ncbi:MAG: HAMP domain-containing histidine kinase [Treponema sp.]|jgi:signal transduction histidine kinase|nr:HAMP domain-containing histidine kinase [Treponema sp.]